MGAVKPFRLRSFLLITCSARQETCLRPPEFHGGWLQEAPVTLPTSVECTSETRPAPPHRHDDKRWANVVNVRKFRLFVLSMQAGAGHHPEAGFTSHCGRKRSAEQRALCAKIDVVLYWPQASPVSPCHPRASGGHSPAPQPSPRVPFHRDMGGWLTSWPAVWDVRWWHVGGGGGRGCC